MSAPGVLRHLRPPRRNRLTPRMTEAVAEYALHGSYKEAAVCMGIAPNSIKQHLLRAHRAMDCGGSIDTLRALGWLRVPPSVTKHGRPAA